MATVKYASIIASVQELTDIISQDNSSHDKFHPYAATIDMYNIIGYKFVKEYTAITQRAIVKEKLYT